MPAVEPIVKSRRYERFVKDRDKALERIHVRAQKKISDITRKAFEQVMLAVSGQYSLVPKERNAIYARQQRISMYRQDLERIFADASFEIVSIQKDLRKIAYVLSHAGEAEAIGRAVGKPQKVELTKEDMQNNLDSETMTGGDPFERTFFHFKKLADKLVYIFEIGAIQKADLKTVIERSLKALPKTRKAKISKANVIKQPKLTEAATKDKAKKIVTGFIDAFAWAGIEQEYLDDYIPNWRGPEFVVDTLGIKTKKKTDNEVYGWEIERDTMNDFVQQVRQGQQDAARKNGINELIWIAIIDSKTDDCCRWRDGLTTSEIEHELRTKRANDKCQAVTAPAHFNCRCRMAPMIEDLPEKEPDELGSFADWVKEMENS